MIKIGNQVFDTEHKTYIMGILNVTPDSFSDGGKFNSADHALWQVDRMIKEGAHIIDLGGESTRPGYTSVSAEEEIARVLPVIEAVKKRFDIPISLDTSKAAVADEGIRAGADMINDIWGLKKDKRMASVIAAHQTACCLMHNRAEAVYKDFLLDWLEDIHEILHLADLAGIRQDGILLDPGVGFGKTYEQNLLVLRHLDRLHVFGYPLLIGTSRKSVIGQTLNVPVNERVLGTAVTTAYAVSQHCGFVRVHDVRENAQAIRMVEAIRDAK